MNILKAGQCYELAFHHMLENPEDKLVHAEVTGTGGNVAGVKYGHAFILKGPTYQVVWDVCQQSPMAKKFYYELGSIKEGEPHEYIYTLEEMVAKALDSGHYGPWDLKTESGL
tara:strand:- start:792 stop:1130 length:339 start_codon:yes stop_codon:yes gene_type:complete